MPEPVRTTILVLVILGFILVLSGVVTPFWGSGILTKMDKEKGLVESLFDNNNSPDFISASIWNSESWWPDDNVIGSKQAKGDLTEAKVVAVFSLLLGIAAIILHVAYTFVASFIYNKYVAASSGVLQTMTGVLVGILCAIMGGCLNNKMASNPLFKLGDSFIISVIGGILYGVCGLFTLVHFVYAAKEDVKDRILLLAHPDYSEGHHLPEETFPTSTSIVGHVQ